MEAQDSWQVLETASKRGAAGAPEHGGSERMRLERRAKVERIGKGQHILLRQRGVMKDAMIKCSSLAFSGHCAGRK